MKVEDLDLLLDNGLLVYQHYMGTNVRVRKKYRSPLRPGQDQHPSFSLFQHDKTGQIWFSDFTIPKTGSHWDFVKELYGVSFKEAINLVQRDILGFGNGSPIDFKPVVQQHRSKLKTITLEKPVLIEPKFRNWNKYDLDFFAAAHIHAPTLAKYFANPWESFRMSKDDKTFTISDLPSDPIYGFSFPSGNSKVYRPRSDRFKWTSNTRADVDVFGLHTLPEKCDKISLNAGNRDTMAFHDLTGIPALALNSETVMLPYELYEFLSSRLNPGGKLIGIYDNDATGQRMLNRLSTEMGIVPAMEPIVAYGVNDFCKMTEGMLKENDTQGLQNLRDYYLGL